MTVQDLKAALTNFGQQISQGQGKNAKQDLNTLYDMYGPQVLDGLIRQKLILYQADQLNLGASDREVQSQLRQIPMFNPWPGPEGYRLRLQQQFGVGMTPVRFEDQLRGSIAQEHLRSFIDLDPSGEFVAGLVTSFAVNSRQALADMRRAVADGRAAEAAGLAHQLKGTSSTLGIREMTRLCAALEGMALRGDLTGAAAAVEQCEREFQAGLAALDVFLVRHRGQGLQAER